jgi:uncharacterized membrane protein YgdD (TMEM256/DUF423 family)
MNWSAVASIGLGLAVMLGAFGAHALKDRLDAYSIGVYEKAVFYHFIHALGLLIVSVFARLGMLTESAATWIGSLLVAGILLFSGSLYILAVSGIRALGAVTPFGGIAFIVAWFLLAFSLMRGR